MSMMMAIATPINSGGVPSYQSMGTVSMDDRYVVSKEYSCLNGGHNFEVGFESPINMPVFWECPDHEVIAYEA